MTTDQTLELFLPFDRFRVLEVKRTLADGRASSWLAEQKDTRRRVLLKWITRPVDNTFESWLTRHDWIGWGRITEIKRGPAQSCIVRDWIEGITLSELIGDGTAVVQEQYMRLLFARVCRVLSRLHQTGAAHGRLKPANLIALEKNVFITDPESSTTGRHGVMADVTKEVEVDGDPHYMSPEQLRNEPVTPASDVYTLACILYETLAGRPPFGHANPMMLCYLHFSAQPEPLWKFRSDITHAMEMLLRKCLAKDPAVRFSDAAELEVALMEGVEGYEAELALAARYEDSLKLMSRLQQARLLAAAATSPGNALLTAEQDEERRAALLERLREAEEQAARGSEQLAQAVAPPPASAEASKSRTSQLSRADIRRAMELARQGVQPADQPTPAPIASAPVPGDYEPIPSAFEFPPMESMTPLTNLDGDGLPPKHQSPPSTPTGDHATADGWEIAFLLVLIYALAVTVILIRTTMQVNPSR